MVFVFAKTSTAPRAIPFTDWHLQFHGRDGLRRNRITTTSTTNSSTHTMGDLGQGGGGGSWGHRFFDFFDFFDFLIFYCNLKLFII